MTGHSFSRVDVSEILWSIQVAPGIEAICTPIYETPSCGWVSYNAGGVAIARRHASDLNRTCWEKAHVTRLVAENAEKVLRAVARAKLAIELIIDGALTVDSLSFERVHGSKSVIVGAAVWCDIVQDTCEVRTSLTANLNSGLILWRSEFDCDDDGAFDAAVSDVKTVVVDPSAAEVAVRCMDPLTKLNLFKLTK